MEETMNLNVREISQTSMDTSRNSSHNSQLLDSADSGYLTLTPRSGSYTPIISGCRSRMSSSKRHYYHRIRADPLHSDRALRHRTKLKQQLALNVSQNERLFAQSLDRQRSSSILIDDGIAVDRSNFSLEQFDSPEGPSYNDFSSERQQDDDQEEHRCREVCRGGRRSRGSWRTTIPITPASAKLQLLSPPPSPAVPSSSFIASEPIEEDVEMKLVIAPQSTPQITVTAHFSPSKRRTTTPPPPLIIASPTGRKTSPIVTSVDNKKLSRLSIKDLPNLVEIKPKRLDFSHRAFSVALHRTRATPDYTGREKVDLLSLLGEKSNHWRIISKIFSFLGPQDLCSISMVSKVWRRICSDDSRANMRRLSHVILRQNVKENLKLIKKAKLDGDVQTSPKSTYVRKGYLLEVQNLLQVPAQQRPPNSPPVSPSKVKFHSFVKASRTLEPWEHLLPCPKCSFPCHVDGEKNVGTCSRQGCSMEFCTSCSSRPHTGPCKTPLLATPTKRNKRLVVGSRQSKRNLRRL